MGKAGKAGSALLVTAALGAVIGVEPDFFTIKRWPADQGRLFGWPDGRRSARVALLGSLLARDLFPGDSPIGQRLLINRVPFEIVGVLAERGQGLDTTNEDTQVYVPLATATRRLANVEHLSGILLEVVAGEPSDAAAQALRFSLAARHRQLGGTPEDFQVLSRKELLDARLAVSDRLLGYVRWSGACFLGVAGLGVLAISWMAVRELTREIGVRRAVGATGGDVFLQALAPTALLSLCGCLVGLAFAWRSTELLAEWLAQPAIFDWATARAALAVSLGLNLVFSAYPAWAARVDPMEALRFE